MGETPIKVKKLGHLVYEVSDVERTARFWIDVMGFVESDRNEGGMVFLRCAAEHHAIALMPSKKSERPASNSGLAINHLALEVEDADALLAAKAYFEANGVSVKFEGRRGPGSNLSLHFCDPDGYEFELYCGMDQIGTDGRSRPAEQFGRVDSLEEAIANPVPKSW
jgi:catechol 2,3-dioxygenase-like lactoylglutathione lyase family enzyme